MHFFIYLQHMLNNCSVFVFHVLLLGTFTLSPKNRRQPSHNMSCLFLNKSFMSSRCNADSDYISSKSWLLKNRENSFQILNNQQTGSIGNDFVSNTCYSACQGYAMWIDPPPALRIKHSEEGLSPLSNSEKLFVHFERTNPYIETVQKWIYVLLRIRMVQGRECGFKYGNSDSNTCLVTEN